ncbi:hypothetical protein A3L12_04055 [Thermococcus sp. P6]|uniref:hypothetical protein n=1 Tax=Thermococcus sp. P6 TaxID=122420 RepID=UPI000B5A04BD|nr:hypothetical protein [Thermococcus sp. P6]ASJ11314.1 hypothetical protein A3L12_04055 [Thermococcus sp. P6]
MKRLLLLIPIALLLLPSVSAGVTYYPDQGAFQAFLNSNSSYTVVAGNEDWAKGWGRYVDARLHTIKPHGGDTTVLVGNVLNNPRMKEIWNRTGLPENASLLPSIVVLNDTVLITGSEDNVYLTERAFEGLWNPPDSSVIGSLMIVLAIFLSFLILLRRDEGHAGSFYLLSSSLLGLWYLTASRPALTESFLHRFMEALKFAAGGPPDSPLAVVIGTIIGFVPPLEENMVFLHWILVLLMASFFFYLAPKRARELGFIVFGILLASPFFRESLNGINENTLGLTVFTITLAIVNNVTFSPERWKALLQTVVLSAFTLLTVWVNPYLFLIPVIFVLTFPKRHLRNYAYLIITGTGVILTCLKFGLPIPSHVDPHGLLYLGRFLLNGILPLALITYVAVEDRKRIRMKGQTAFLLLMMMVYLPLALFVPSLFPYCLILLTALAVRMIHSFTPRT